MSFLKDKNVLIGITASIAAYKSAFLIREFIKKGANVRVIQTTESQQFITPLTLSTLSKNPVLVELTKEDGKIWNNHVEIGLWADLFVIAPVTAKTLSKMANGRCDNLLISTYLSAKCPVFFAPAMDLDMFKHQSTQENINKLVSYGNIYIPPGDGELASGLYGKGRMAEPLDIITSIEKKISDELPLQNKNILVTAGPTYESIDPVRFIGNYSSGKMGFSIADSAANLGANVTLISGPTKQKLKNSNINLINVVSAEEMFERCTENFKQNEIIIMSAAVSDYTPKYILKNKIKKKSQNLNLELVKTKDILHTLSKNKTPEQLLVGFALETANEIENAKKKLFQKKIDFIVLNSLNDEGSGFDNDTNKITIIDKIYSYFCYVKSKIYSKVTE